MFDLSITVMGIMFVPDSGKAMEHLYRTTKQGGTCYITTWKTMQHKDIGERVIERLCGKNWKYSVPKNFWKPEWNDPNYLVSELERVGFKDCQVETSEEYIFYPGPEGVACAVGLFSMQYGSFIDLKEEEQEQWKQLWEEEIKQDCLTKDGIKIKMVAIIAWGNK
jgi:hypothetical protein